MHILLYPLFLLYASMNGYILLILLLAGFSIFFVALMLARLFDYREVFRLFKFRYRKRIEMHNRALQKEKDALQEKVDALKMQEQELLLKKMKLERQEHLKDFFLNNLSHEIRNPLNSIVGLSHLINEDFKGEQGTISSYSEKIIQSCNRLLRLMDNFLDLSQMEIDNLVVNLEDFDINKVIREIEEVYIFRVNSKKLSLKIDFYSVPFVYGDRKLFFKSLGLIVDNIMHQLDRGTISIRASREVIHDRICVSVEGKGPIAIPVPVDYLMDDTHTELTQEELLKGMSFGIQLASKLLRLMGGDIQVIKEQELIRANLYLPLAIGLVDGYLNVEEKKVAPLAKNSILLVEDDPLSRLILSKMLIGDYKLEVASTADEAIQLVKEKAQKDEFFNLVLLDINLPDGWDGVHLMHYLRDHFEAYTLIPFIAQTSYALPEQRNRILREGFDDFIAKPVMREQLQHSIVRQLATYY